MAKSHDLGFTKMYDFYTIFPCIVMVRWVKALGLGHTLWIQHTYYYDSALFPRVWVGLSELPELLPPNAETKQRLSMLYLKLFFNNWAFTSEWFCEWF